ncbi:MAG: hypothetical protein IPM39_25070 [Chloroflexi bacterium]|nr:hypothetical protein [Chloroflexota bacterium]
MKYIIYVMVSEYDEEPYAEAETLEEAERLQNEIDEQFFFYEPRIGIEYEVGESEIPF